MKRLTTLLPAALLTLLALWPPTGHARQDKGAQGASQDVYIREDSCRPRCQQAERACKKRRKGRAGAKICRRELIFCLSACSRG